MRNTKAMLALLILALPTVGLAQTIGTMNSEPAPTVSFTNSMMDTLSATGDISFDWETLGDGYHNTTVGATAMTLAYATSNNDNPNPRRVTVALGAALPAGISGTVTFTPDSGNGTSGGAVVLSQVAKDLVTGIPVFAVQDAKALNYTFAASKGFDDVGAEVNVVFTMLDQ